MALYFDFICCFLALDAEKIANTLPLTDVSGG
jgi:hypothetical protein